MLTHLLVAPIVSEFETGAGTGDTKETLELLEAAFKNQNDEDEAETRHRVRE
ncbi:MAG: hypothetical protein ABJN14_09100 [Paracoccaceae bacterium]